MSDDRVDPSGNTEAFRAFTEHAAKQDSPKQTPIAAKTPLIVVGVVVAVILIAWLAL
ncbi:MAG TPA: hypothetical protein VGB74_00960 [Actinoplanes sp.]